MLLEKDKTDYLIKKVSEEYYRREIFNQQLMSAFLSREQALLNFNHLGLLSEVVVPSLRAE